MLIVDIGELSGTDKLSSFADGLPPQQLPIIVVSACSQAMLEWVEAAFERVKTLRKPFKISTLFQLVEQVNVNSSGY